MEIADGFRYTYFGGMLGVYWVDYPQDDEGHFVRKWYFGRHNLFRTLRNLRRINPETVFVDRRPRLDALI